MSEFISEYVEIRPKTKKPGTKPGFFFPKHLGRNKWKQYALREESPGYLLHSNESRFSLHRPIFISLIEMKESCKG